MSGFLGLDSNREVIRVNVKKCDGLMQPEMKRFSLDPQITSFEMLQNILARAFDIKSDFTISYMSTDERGQEVYLSMLSDWDMDAAFQNASDPSLRLKVDLKPFDEALEDWDIIAPVEIPQYRFTNFLQQNSFLGNITGTISSQMEKTMSTVQKVMGLKSEEEQVFKPLKTPMTDMEFRNYLDSDGHMVKPEEFRLSIYQGGIEPSLRRVVWRHLLNIYPNNLSGKERFDYMKRKEQEYYELRDQWKKIFNSSKASEEAKHVAQLVKKDVLRTDRTHKYFSGGDDSKNLISLFHVLVTFALSHPEISYCQGMSDLASPLLVVQKDEAQAYLCFCGLMKRLRSNFLYDGKAITTKFQHLADLLQFYDPTFYMYLKDRGAEDLFFCYRWLLLEMKREFPFDDSLYMLEVMWSTLPPSPPDHTLDLKDTDYSSHMLLSVSPHSPTFAYKQNLYAHLLAKRRHSTTPRKEMSPSSPRVKPSEEEISRNSVNNNSRMSIEDKNENMSSPVTADRTENLRNHSFTPDPLERFPSLISASLEDIELTPRQADDTQDDKKVTGSFDEIQAGYNADTFKCKEEEPAKTDNHSKEMDEEDGPSQFYLSMEENERPAEDKKIPEIKGSFFSGMKKILSSPKKKPFKNLTLNVGSTNNVRKNTGVLKNNNGPSMTAKTVNGPQSTAKTVNGPQSTAKTVNGPQSLVIEDSGDNTLFDRHSKSTDSGNASDNSSQSDISQTTSMNGSVSHSDSDSGKGPTTDNILLANQREYEQLHHGNSKIQCENPSLLSCQDPDLQKLDLGRSDEAETSQASENGEEGKLSECIEVTDDQELQCSGLKQLPPPDVFGYGNPFLMFLCLTVLLQHRDVIIKNRMEYDELAMYFDRMVRKHNVHKVLAQSRAMYTDYIKMQQKLQLEEADDTDFSV